MSSDELTAREREVLELVARGRVDKEIAAQLRISRSTLRSHLSSIFLKTEAANRTAAAWWYFNNAADSRED